MQARSLPSILILFGKALKDTNSMIDLSAISTKVFDSWTMANFFFGQQFNFFSQVQAMLF